MARKPEEIPKETLKIAISPDLLGFIDLLAYNPHTRGCASYGVKAKIVEDALSFFFNHLQTLKRGREFNMEEQAKNMAKEEQDGLKTFPVVEEMSHTDRDTAIMTMRQRILKGEHLTMAELRWGLELVRAARIARAGKIPGSGKKKTSTSTKATKAIKEKPPAMTLEDFL